MTVRWPGNDQSKVGHDLHDVHQIPHCFQADSEEDSHAELGQECSVGGKLHSATGCGDQLKEILRGELLWNGG